MKPAMVTMPFGIAETPIDTTILGTYILKEKKTFLKIF